MWTPSWESDTDCAHCKFAAESSSGITSPGKCVSSRHVECCLPFCLCLLDTVILCCNIYVEFLGSHRISSHLFYIYLPKCAQVISSSCLHSPTSIIPALYSSTRVPAISPTIPYSFPRGRTPMASNTRKSEFSWISHPIAWDCFEIWSLVLNFFQIQRLRCLVVKNHLRDYTFCCTSGARMYDF